MSSDEEHCVRDGNGKKEEERRFAQLAKEKIAQWVEEGRMDPLPVTLTDEILLPRPPSVGIHYCILCRKHGSFRLAAHIRSKHPEYINDSDDFRVIEQVSRGITENMKRASVDLRLVPAPMNIREYNIMKAMIDQLTAGGIPVYGQVHKPSWEAMPYQESAEVSQAPRLDLALRQHQGMPEARSAAVPQTVESLTYGAPLIARHELYMTPVDTLYLGGASIHPQFTAPPRVELMFAHEQDSSVPGCYEQRYLIHGRNCDWMLEADRRLKLWRRLPLELHPLLKQFSTHIETRVLLPDFGSEKGEVVVLKGRAHYESYISRFMIVAMRARQRLGQTVSMDDGIYSSAVVMEFFQELQKCRVPVHTRIGFAQAIAGFYDFLNVYIDAAASRFRLPAVAQARSRISYVLERLRNELKSLSTYRAVRQAPAKEHEPYVVARAIATHKKILATLRCIYSRFGRTEFISRQQYNYFLGALMFYIIQCNTARNEVVYKMRFGSIVDFSEMGHAQTGLRRIKLDIDGGKKELFVGAYPHPKSLNRVREESTFRGGFFVLDRESLFLTDVCHSFRLWIAEKQGIDRKTIEQPTSAFFLGYNGEPITRTNVQRLLKRFLNNSGLGTLKISCNTSRHDAARIQYERFFSASYQEYSVVDKDCAVLEGHRPRTQLLNYNDNYIMACAKAYHKLQLFADEESHKYTERIDRACSMVHIADLGLNETEGDDTSEHSSSSRSDDDDDDEASVGEEEQGSPLAKRRRSQREASQSTEQDPAPGYMECSSAESTQHSEIRADATEEVYRENIDDITQILQRFNKRTYDGGLTRLQTIFEKKDFFRRRGAKPVQDYPWLEVRELPAPVNGRGIFAKVEIPKNYVVCDYRGKELHWDDADRRLNALRREDQKIVESYMVEYNFHIRAIHFHHAILAHSPTYKGTVVLGRLINHSALHPNLALEVTSMRQEILQPLVYFRTTRKVKAGEQLLWDYGPKFGRNLSCICNSCRPDVLAGSTATLRPSTYPAISGAPWSQQPSLSQEVIAGSGMRAPLSVSDVLIAAAHRAGAAAFIEDSAGTSAMAAYEKSRRVVLGTSEKIAGALSMPSGVNNLYHLLCAAHFDAFALGNPTIITIRKNRRDFRPLVLLFGSALPAESTRRYGSCVTYVITEDSTYAVDYQRSTTTQRDSLDVEYQAGMLVCLQEIEDDLWDRILKTATDPRSLTRLLSRQGWQSVVIIGQNRIVEMKKIHIFPPDIYGAAFASMNDASSPVSAPQENRRKHLT